MRPRTLDEFVGQRHILAPGRLLRRAIEADQLTSLILSGPPGTGKTTLARVIAGQTRAQFLSLNAVLGGVKDIREAIDAAQQHFTTTHRRTILFVDEVHRWNRSQQDALLPWVEDGLFILVGATTENPFFEVNKALLSRSRVFVLDLLTDDDLTDLAHRALADPERGYGRRSIQIDPDALAHLVHASAGDARTLLNALELAVESSAPATDPGGQAAARAGGTIIIDLAVAEQSIQKKALLYDKDGDYHFDTISAFIKSVRGSDPDAALYWLARMIAAGEDPRYIIRRLIILAAEDVGLADPGALGIVVAAADAFDRVGMPEGQFHLAHATLYLATTEKSNSTLGYFDALTAVGQAGRDDVPDHLRDASRDGEALAHGKGYHYPHAYHEHWVAQTYLPTSLAGRLFYQPGPLGWEGAQEPRLAAHRAALLSEDAPEAVWAVAPTTRGPTSDVPEGDAPLLEHLALRSIDRVALIGSMTASLVVPVARQTPGGSLAVWTDVTGADLIRWLISRRTLSGEGEYAPLVIDNEAREQIASRGPFDRIVIRRKPSASSRDTPSDAPPCDRLGFIELSELLDTGGTLSVVELEPAHGTRPSEILELEEDAREALSRAESLTGARHGDLDAHAGTTEADGAKTTTYETLAPRRVTRQSVESWFRDDAPLARHLLEISDAEVVRHVRSVAARWRDREVSWRRTWRVTDIPKRSA